MHREQPGRGGPPRGEMRGPSGERGYQAERPARRFEQDRRAQPRTQSHEEQRQEQRRATERRSQERQRVDRSREERNAERDKAVRERRDVEQRQRAERPRTNDQPQARHEEMQQARTRLSMQDRERLHRSLDVDRARLRNVKFDFHVGHRIPRTVHLFPVPREVIAFFPYYRDYDYVVIDDDICIVDPATYVVVDVIEHTYWGRPQVAGLRLSPSQIALVRDSIPADFPEADVRLRLGLGVEIPDFVELHELPVLVIDRVPELRDFRFLVADDQIVIVDPRDRSIALVIDRA